MVDYSTITELPNSKVTKLQIARAYHRYMFGASFCQGKDVLEVACGGGQGLGLLAHSAKKVVGGDCEAKNLVYARETYQNKKNVEVVQLDAHHMQFSDKSFDVILLYEAIYYFHAPEKFLDECRRLLRKDGMLIICTANKNWPAFNPSPFSYRYYSVPEMKDLCTNKGFQVEFFGAFPDVMNGPLDKLKSILKKVAVSCAFMPKTMGGKVLLKRIFYGGLVTMPRELEPGMNHYSSPTPLKSSEIDTNHTALYAVCRLQDQ